MPVLGLGIVLIGALQHRLAGLGHEAAHYSLLKNKVLNDLIGDVFCMFPILSTIHFYRLFHLAHHQYTNDPNARPGPRHLGREQDDRTVPDVAVGIHQVLWVLWVLPLMTSFPFFMLLRDVYQHTNADDGRLTNTRVFFPDPFIRWAVFVYGQDMHLPHHLFPAIPHHRLGRLHQLLKARHPDYAASVVECHGTFANRKGLPTILDTLTTRRPDR